MEIVTILAKLFGSVIAIMFDDFSSNFHITSIYTGCATRKLKHTTVYTIKLSWPVFDIVSFGYDHTS